MKHSLAIIILILLGSCKLTSTNHVKSDLNGKVKKIIETTDFAYLEYNDYKSIAVDPLFKKTTLRSYNKQGELVEMKSLRADNIIYKVEINYNSNSQMSEQKHFDQSEQLVKVVERTSDTTTVSKDLRGLGTVLSTERQLSPKIEQLISKNLQQNYTTISIIKRDNRHWVIETEETQIFKNDTTSRFEYRKYTELDKKDNWTKCLISTTTQFDSVQVKSREIEYY